MNWSTLLETVRLHKVLGLAIQENLKWNKAHMNKKPRDGKPPQKHSVNQLDFDESEEEILSVCCGEEEINAVNNHSNKILATVKIGGKEVKVLIDSGASYNFLPIKDLPKGTVVEKSSHTLKMYSKSNKQPLVKQKSP